jgi:hypothetical protein
MKLELEMVHCPVIPKERDGGEAKCLEGIDLVARSERPSYESLNLMLTLAV